jgi:hypothetical protein
MDFFSENILPCMKSHPEVPARLKNRRGFGMTVR